MGTTYDNGGLRAAAAADRAAAVTAAAELALVGEHRATELLDAVTDLPDARMGALGQAAARLLRAREAWNSWVKQYNEAPAALRYGPAAVYDFRVPQLTCLAGELRLELGTSSSNDGYVDSLRACGFTPPAPENARNGWVGGVAKWQALADYGV